MTQVNFEIGQTVKNTVTGKIEKVKTVKHGYVNGYRADLWQLVEGEAVSNNNNLPESLLTAICFRQARWNKKFYGNFIYIDNVKYEVSYKQKEELSRHFEIDF